MIKIHGHTLPRPAFRAICMLLLLTSCAPLGWQTDQQAQRLDFIRQTVRGEGFDHTVYFNTASGRRLHVYLDGDGAPWLRSRTVAADPTPRWSLVLDLMAQDPAPALYLGRPCYHGYAKSEACSAELWTGRRYGPEVVSSMAQALTAWLRTHPYSEIVFIGHSGGGALAMLLAERFPTTRAVLTVAGNLDSQQWVEWHGYLPLFGSLNPATREPLPVSVKQLHYSGALDQNVPQQVVHDAVKRQPDAEFVVVQGFDHTCCWRDRWPSILLHLRRILTQ